MGVMDAIWMNMWMQDDFFRAMFKCQYIGQMKTTCQTLCQFFV